MITNEGEVEMSEIVAFGQGWEGVDSMGLLTFSASLAPYRYSTGTHANDTLGAINTSKFSLTLPKSLAVKLFVL